MCLSPPVKRIIFYIVSVILVIDGILLFSMSIVVIVKINKLQCCKSESFIIPTYLLLVIGIVLIFTGITELIAGYMKKMLILKVCILIIIVTTLVVMLLSLYLHLKQLEITLELRKELLESMERTYTSPMDIENWKVIQRNNVCCGIDGPEDWHGHKTVDLSGFCCRRPTFDEHERVACEESIIFKEGCIGVLATARTHYAIFLWPIGYITVFIELVSLISILSIVTLAKS